MKQLMQEFKAFAMKGNVIDLAVGVTIGAAFGKIVSSLVNDIIMPLVSILTGGLNITDWKFVIKAATDTTVESALFYGKFFQNIIDFFIIALSIFVVIKALNRFKKKEESKEGPAEDQLSVLKDIRDQLNKNR